MSSPLTTQLDDLVLRRWKDASANRRRTLYVGSEFRIMLDNASVVTVPAGFATDLASIPFLFRPIMSRLDGIEASIVHDYLYTTHQLPRKRADQIFLSMLVQDLGVGKIQAELMYRAVRLFGRRSWARPAVPGSIPS